MARPVASAIASATESTWICVLPFNGSPYAALIQMITCFVKGER